jgi:hypothetical protein
MRVINGIHDYAANMWPLAEVSGPSGFADNHVLVLYVANLTKCSPAGLKHHAELAGRQPECGVLAFFSHELSSGSG